MKSPAVPFANEGAADWEQPSIPIKPTPVIELEGLSVQFGRRPILENLTCSVSGKSIGLLGPNGAGKTTLINTLLGFHKPASGYARILTCDVGTDRRKIRAMVGYMPENDALIANMSAVSFVRMMAEISGLPRHAALERAHEALFFVGLSEARYRKLGTYSLGMKQLAKLAQAIVHGPQLLILDEPTNGLDPGARQRMIHMLREMRSDKELHILICSHLLRDIEECCEEVLILKQGRIVHHSTLQEESRANRRFLELEIYGENGDFREALESWGCECATLGHRMKIVLPEGTEVRDIYALAAEREVRIRRLNFRRDTLEDIFLRAMENENCS